MTDKKKAVWPIARRADDLADSRSWQRTQGESGDSRRQSSRKPDPKAQKLAKKWSS